MKFTQRINRPQPKMATHKYRTYRIAAPASHWRTVSCQEFDCQAYREGWSYSKADLIAENLLYKVTHAGRKWKEIDLGNGPWIYFFPGQKCFQAPTHRVLERPEIYVTGRGDFRSFSLRQAQVLSGENWLDHFANHQDKLKTIQDRG